MGLIAWKDFSSIPNFQARSKAVQTEKEQQLLRHEDEVGRVYFSDHKFSTTGLDQVIFTVPVGSDFILLAAWCSQSATNASGSGNVEINTTNPAMPIVISTNTIGVPSATGTLQDSNSVNFGRGIRFKAGDIFTLAAGSSQSMIGGISGFVVETKLK